MNHVHAVFQRWRARLLLGGVLAVLASLSRELFALSVETTQALQRDIRGVVQLRMSWVKNGSLGSDAGTGFVHKGHVITVSHHFPAVGSVDALLIEGRTEAVQGAPSQSFRLEKVFGDAGPDIDLAVLRPTEPAVLTEVPINWTAAPIEGTEVWMRGFPRGGHLEGAPGAVSGTPASRITRTTAIVGRGFSGGPVYDTKGTVIGYVQGGEPLANAKDPDALGEVKGNGYFLLLGRLPDQVKQKIELATVSRPIVQPNLELAKQPDVTLRLSYGIDVTKDDHGFWYDKRTYRRTFAAAPGYRIVRFEVVDLSANYTYDRRTTVSEEGTTLTHEFTLESGPVFDRRRGWLTSTVNTVQEPIRKAQSK